MLPPVLWLLLQEPLGQVTSERSPGEPLPAPVLLLMLAAFPRTEIINLTEEKRRYILLPSVIPLSIRGSEELFTEVLGLLGAGSGDGDVCPGERDGREMKTVVVTR